MAKRCSFVEFVMFLWFGCFCDALDDADPLSVGLPPSEIPVIDDTGVGLQSDSSVSHDMLMDYPFLKSYLTPAATMSPVGDLSFESPVPPHVPMGKPTYPWPATTMAPIGDPTYPTPAATMAPVGEPSFERPLPPTVTPVGKPSYHKPVTTATRVTPSLDPGMPMPDAVKADCGESSLQVYVRGIQLSVGQPVHRSEITLGDCRPVGYDKANWMLYFVTELHGCGSTQTMTEDSLIYTYSLNYQPKALVGTPIIRSSDAVVMIQCHYPRLHNVSSNTLNPTWIPFQSTMSAEEQLVFTMRLMDDDWQQERESHTYFLGDVLKIEASVVQANHVPLNVFIDRCVAYLDPNLNPSYAFINEDGCLMDSKLPGSRSAFLPRLQNNKLRVQVDTFRFAHEAQSSIYFYCHLKATVAPDHYGGKACSFSPEAGRWLSLSGREVCSCCEASSCVPRKGRSLEESAQWEGEAFLGPITIKQAAARDQVSGSEISLSKVEDPKAAGASPVAMAMAGVIVAVGIVCAIALSTVLHWRRRKCVLYEGSGE